MSSEAVQPSVGTENREAGGVITVVDGHVLLGEGAAADMIVAVLSGSLRIVHRGEFARTCEIDALHPGSQIDLRAYDRLPFALIAEGDVSIRTATCRQTPADHRGVEDDLTVDLAIARTGVLRGLSVRVRKALAARLDPRRAERQPSVPHQPGLGIVVGGALNVSRRSESGRVILMATVATDEPFAVPRRGVDIIASRGLDELASYLFVEESELRRLCEVEPELSVVWRSLAAACRFDVPLPPRSLFPMIGGEAQTRPASNGAQSRPSLIDRIGRVASVPSQKFLGIGALL